MPIRQKGWTYYFTSNLTGAPFNMIFTYYYKSYYILKTPKQTLRSSKMVNLPVKKLIYWKNGKNNLPVKR